ILITNQDGIGTADFPWDGFLSPMKEFLRRLAAEGIFFSAICICPHHSAPKEVCTCRKPQTTMVDQVLQGKSTDVAFMLGDRTSDEGLAQALKIPFIRVETNDPFPIEDIQRIANSFVPLS